MESGQDADAVRMESGQDADAVRMESGQTSAPLARGRAPARAPHSTLQYQVLDESSRVDQLDFSLEDSARARDMANELTQVIKVKACAREEDRGLLLKVALLAIADVIPWDAALDAANGIKARNELAAQGKGERVRNAAAYFHQALETKLAGRGQKLNQLLAQVTLPEWILTRNTPEDAPRDPPGTDRERRETPPPTEE
jgi:hypothetical protein